MLYVTNFSEYPIKIVSITNASYLKCLRTYFVTNERETEVFPALIPNNEKSSAPYKMSHYDEYDLEAYDLESEESDPADEQTINLGNRGWAVFAIYIDLDFEDNFTFWRLIEAQKGLVIYIRDEDIDETEIVGKPVGNEDVVQMNTIQEIIRSIERKHGKLEQ